MNFKGALCFRIMDMCLLGNKQLRRMLQWIELYCECDNDGCGNIIWGSLTLSTKEQGAMKEEDSMRGI